MWKFVLMLFALSFCVFAIQSGDAMMYLAIARDFILAGEWRQGDVQGYLYPATDGQFIWHHEYLTSLIFYSTWWLSGFAGLIVLKMFVLAILFLTVLRSQPEKQNGEVVWVSLWVLAVLAGSFRYIERASLFSDLFAVLIAGWLLSESRLTKNLLLRLLILFWLWIQLHPGFVLGFVFVGIWTVWQALTNREFERRRALLLLLIPLVMLINPDLWDGLLYPFRFAMAEAKTLRLYNFEWFPAYHRVFRFTPEMLSFWLLSLLTGFFILHHRAWRSLNAVFALAAFLFTLQAVRFVPFAVMTLLLCVKPWARFKAIELQKPWLKAGLAALLILVAVKNFAYGYMSSSGERIPSLALDPKFFPSRTLDVLSQLPNRGNIYNSHDFGAYLIWKQIKPVFHHGFVTDMRFYREEVIGALQSQAQFLSLANKYGWKVLLVDKHGGYREIHRILSPLPDWKIIAEDEAAYLIVKMP